jgi:hypothetical protein
MQNLVIAGLDPVILSLDQSVKDWMPRSSRVMTWVGVGAIRYKYFALPDVRGEDGAQKNELFSLKICCHFGFHSNTNL